MRIAMLAHTNSPWTGHYVRYFQAEGCEVRVFSLSPDPLPDCDVVYLADRDGALGKLGLLRNVPRIRRMLREQRPDVVFATYLSSNGITAALCWSGPLLVSARGGDVLEQAGYRPAPPWLLGPLLRFVCRRADRVHAVSEELVQALTGYGIPADRITRFPMGIDPGRFAPRADGTGGNRPPRIICTRRQDHVYDNPSVVRALGLLRDRGHGFTATFLGGGPLLHELQELIRDLHLDPLVECRGETPHADLPRLLGEADIYVSASTSDGTSSSLLEALACGLFPVVSRIRANEPWVVDGENGLLFEPRDADGLARALARALGDAEWRRRATETNRRTVERQADLRANLRRTMELLQACIEAHR
jgi:glycosyltransferase involved in cell wall biosynthesis